MERPYVRYSTSRIGVVGDRILTWYLLRDFRSNLRKSQLVEFVLEIGNEVFKEIELVWWRVGVVKKVENGECELVP